MTDNITVAERFEILEDLTRKVYSAKELAELTLSSRDRDILLHLTEIIIVVEDDRN
jgi:hypothetical protein